MPVIDFAAHGPILAQAMDPGVIGTAIINWGPPGVLCAYLFWQLSSNKKETKDQRDAYETRLKEKDDQYRQAQEQRIVSGAQIAQSLAETTAANRQLAVGMETLNRAVESMIKALEVQQRVSTALEERSRLAREGS